LTFTFAYTFSKLIDDASTYFSQTIFTDHAHHHRAADAFNRKLERDVSSGDIPRVFSAGWVYRIPRWWKISGWEIGGLARIQAGDAVPVTQAANTLSAFGYAVERPNRAGQPEQLRNSQRLPMVLTSRPSPPPDNSASATVRGIRCGARPPGCRPDDPQDVQISERVNLEFRAEAFNVSNTPPLNDPTEASEARRSVRSRARAIRAISNSLVSCASSS